MLHLFYGIVYPTLFVLLFRTCPFLVRVLFSYMSFSRTCLLETTKKHIYVIKPFLLRSLPLYQLALLASNGNLLTDYFLKQVGFEP